MPWMVHFGSDTSPPPVLNTRVLAGRKPVRVLDACSLFPGTMMYGGRYLQSLPMRLDTTPPMSGISSEAPAGCEPESTYWVPSGWPSAPLRV